MIRRVLFSSSLPCFLMTLSVNNRKEVDQFFKKRIYDGNRMVKCYGEAISEEEQSMIEEIGRCALSHYSILSSLISLQKPREYVQKKEKRNKNRARNVFYRYIGHVEELLVKIIGLPAIPTCTKTSRYWHARETRDGLCTIFKYPPSVPSLYLEWTFRTKKETYEYTNWWVWNSVDRGWRGRPSPDIRNW